MDKITGYKNFLQSFINEGIYWIEEARPLHVSKDPTETYATPEEAANSHPPLQPEGNTNAETIILLNQDCDGWIKPAHEERFHKLLKAIKKDIHSVALLNVYHHDKRQVIRYLTNGKYNKIISLGAEAFLPEDIDQQPFNITSSKDGQYLITPTLDEVFADKNTSLKLWNTLKQLFPEANNT